jgi:hypothetical protein
MDHWTMSDNDRHSLLNDPEHWRKQAVEMRALAEGSRDHVRGSQIKLSIEYDRLADKAEQRLKGAWAERKS